MAISARNVKVDGNAALPIPKYPLLLGASHYMQGSYVGGQPDNLPEGNVRSLRKQGEMETETG